MDFEFTVSIDFDAFEKEVYGAARVMFAKLQEDRSDEVFYSFN